MKNYNYNDHYSIRNLALFAHQCFKSSQIRSCHEFLIPCGCSHRCSSSTLWTAFWLASLCHSIEPAVKSARRQDRTSDFLLHPTTHSIWQWLNRLNHCKFRQSQTEIVSLAQCDSMLIYDTSAALEVLGLHHKWPHRKTLYTLAQTLNLPEFGAKL